MCINRICQVRCVVGIKLYYPCITHNETYFIFWGAYIYTCGWIEWIYIICHTDGPLILLLLLCEALVHHLGRGDVILRLHCLGGGFLYINVTMSFSMANVWPLRKKIDQNINQFWGRHMWMALSYVHCGASTQWWSYIMFLIDSSGYYLGCPISTVSANQVRPAGHVKNPQQNITTMCTPHICRWAKMDRSTYWPRNWSFPLPSAVIFFRPP